MANSRPAFESWGRYPTLQSDLVPLYWPTDFPPKELPPTKMLPVGAGRSYGDVCLLDRGTLFPTRGLDKLLHFDQQTGVLRCEAGITLAEILEFAVPRGFFLPVSPGTKFVTIGGAIANDIHGKNHHVAGTFGRHVVRFELVRSDGSRFMCGPARNADWFAATVGGLGLTGLISWAEIRLRPIVSRKIRYQGIKFVGIDEFVALSEASTKVEYTVAWIDCVASGKEFARGIFMEGDHSAAPEAWAPIKARRLSIPIDFPDVALNRLSVGIFNSLYYRKQFGKRKTGLIDYEPFFYPLDGILHWNKIYGRKGMLQFQCVIPWETGQQEGIVRILKAITASGLASFLAVIKVFGDVPSPGMLTFPKPGITLALDFPIRHEVTFDLFDRLGKITLEHRGKLYPAKDARMTAAQFRAFYPEWEAFSSYIDPRFSSAFWQRVTTLV
jgi:FAD/FMN-containing dehydrogenase